MRSEKAEQILTWLLRILGVLTLLALGAVVMPTEWMAGANDALGLEPFPRSALTEYLTRSLSAIYALIGALTLYVSLNVRRYAALVAFAGKLTVLLGLAFLVLDVWAGLPAVWVWFEGPPTVAIGVVMFVLARRIRE